MAEYKVGDVVTLKSGGPRMTVTHVIGQAGGELDMLAKQMQGLNDGDVLCSWFDGTQPKEKAFPASTVEKG